jgi:hypothetical protein
MSLLIDGHFAYPKIGEVRGANKTIEGEARRADRPEKAKRISGLSVCGYTQLIYEWNEVN